jgi:hypothetical protein
LLYRCNVPTAPTQQQHAQVYKWITKQCHGNTDAT